MLSFDEWVAVQITFVPIHEVILEVRFFRIWVKQIRRTFSRSSFLNIHASCKEEDCRRDYGFETFPQSIGEFWAIPELLN